MKSKADKDILPPSGRVAPSGSASSLGPRQGLRPPPQPRQALKTREAALFRAEDAYADLTEIGDMLEALSAALGRIGRKTPDGADAAPCRFAPIFAELGVMLRKVRWGAVALARLEAAECFAEARAAYEACAGEARTRQERAGNGQAGEERGRLVAAE